MLPEIVKTTPVQTAINKPTTNQAAPVAPTPPVANNKPSMKQATNVVTQSMIKPGDEVSSDRRQGGLDTIKGSQYQNTNDPSYKPIRTKSINVIIPRAKRPKLTTDKLWEEANQNSWYLWAWYTAREMTSKECIICSGSPRIPPIAIPEKYTFEECASVQKQACKLGEFNNASGTPLFFRFSMCGI